MCVNFRIFPWGCVSGFLRRLVPDATPQHHVACGSPSIKPLDEMPHFNGKTINNNTTISSEKANALLIHRMTNGGGERVL